MECGQQRSNVKKLLLHYCSLHLRKFHMTDSQNTHDHITSDRRSKRAFYSFLVEVQMDPGYIHVTHA